MVTQTNYLKQSVNIFHSLEQPPLIEGDIVDDVATRQQIDAEANGIASTFDAIAGRRKWENGVVPYVYGSVGKFRMLSR